MDSYGRWAFSRHAETTAVEAILELEPQAAVCSVCDLVGLTVIGWDPNPVNSTLRAIHRHAKDCRKVFKNEK